MIKEALMRIVKYWFDYTDTLSVMHIGGGMLYEAIEKAYPNAQIIFTDDIYHLATQKTMNTLLGMNVLKFAKFKNNERDCDDYSFGIMGIMRWIVPGFAFGIVHVDSVNGRHALNFFLDEEKRLYYFEPQTNTIKLMKMGRKYKPYLFII